ncbi:MAG: rRNA maturation RNase YbeY, partial [Candidatus Lambdaproteobacteria bacterium]|nr:rRNA maturation RNase YbeY [Candidatus Lambdaproteobacteria bacterium]
MTRAAPIPLSWPRGRSPDLDPRVIRRALRSFLAGLGFARHGVSLLLADDAALAALNSRYRGRDTPTDILSWSYRDDPAPDAPRTAAGGAPRAAAPPLLGELAVSLERVRAQAAEHGWDAQTELLRLLAHGCAHLAGYDHQTRAADRVMRDLEIELLPGVGLGG